MTVPAVIRGNNLKLTIGGTEFNANVTSCVLTNEEADTAGITFYEASVGTTRKFSLNITALQSTDALSLWRYVWENSGSDAAFVLAPHGNAVPTADEPHFTGTCTIGPPGDIGGEVSTSASNRYTFDSVWEVVGTPVLDDGSL